MPATATPTLNGLMPLDVTVNGRAEGRWTILDRNGILYAPEQAFTAWYLRRRVTAESISFQNQTWYPLVSVLGFDARINFQAQTITLNFAANASLPRPAAPAASVAAAIPAASAVPQPSSAALPASQVQQIPQSATNSIAARAIYTGLEGQKELKNPPENEAARYLTLEARVNASPAGQWIFLERFGVLHAPQEAFEEWRVNRRPDAPLVEYRGQNWFALSSVPGFQSQLNFANQSIDLVFSPTAFAATRLASDAAPLPPLSPSIPAFFVNYDLNLNQSKSTGANSTQDLSALTELGFTSALGVLSSSFVGRNLTSGTPGTPSTWRRLETSLTRDLPEQKVTIRLGDSNTRTGVGARSVYFGGLQVSRNFTLAPGFTSQPLPLIQGSSSAPSTVELYVNDALRQTSNVPTGPFAIDNFPLLTGSGQVRVVVRDVLGRETVVVQPFFSHASLLEQGLSDWSFEVGAIRQNLGTTNADYGPRFASGIWRYGVSKSTTVEISGQGGGDTRSAGLGVSTALFSQILGYASVAASRDVVAGHGHQWSLGLEHNSLRHGVSARLSGASQGFRQLGSANNTPNPRESALNYTYSSERLGSLGLGMAKITSATAVDLTTYSANYSIKVGEKSSLTVSATRVAGSSNGTSVGLSLNIPLENRMNSSSTVNHRPGQTDAYTSVSQGLASETGLGWRALAGTRANEVFGEAGVYYQAEKAMLTADASASRNQQSMRLGLQSALVWIDGKVFASRRVQDSFAIVEVPGYANVGVGFQGVSSARTDASGIAFLPRLMPYQSNSIRLDPSELPINAELDNIEQITVPAGRSAVKVTFPVRTGRAALLKIVLDDGQPAPAGAEVELVGDSKEFFVARRGEAFITGLQSKNTLRLKHNGASCTFEVTMPDTTAQSAEEIVRLGPLLCKGVVR